MSLEGEVDERKLAFENLEDVAHGEIHKIGDVAADIYVGTISRDEAILYITEGLLEFTREMKARGIEGDIDSSLKRQYEDAKDALERIRRGERPIYFDGYPI